jgi:hypothetical protein
MTGSPTHNPRLAGEYRGRKPERTDPLPGNRELEGGGLPPEKRRLQERIPSVILPAGYRGKILLVLISVGEESIVVLRSGDLWHREILRNTRAEISGLGLEDAQVDELGGAFLFSESDGSIRIGGGSDEFGACDRDYAAALVRAACPGCAVVVSSGEMA